MFSFLYRSDGRHREISLEEFESHCTKNSLWVSIGKKVYDITDYIPHHPGGIKSLLNNAATDISYHAGFHTKRMKELLVPMLIGELDSQSVRILQQKAILRGQPASRENDCCKTLCC